MNESLSDAQTRALLTLHDGLGIDTAQDVTMEALQRRHLVGDDRHLTELGRRTAEGIVARLNMEAHLRLRTRVLRIVENTLDGADPNDYLNGMERVMSHREAVFIATQLEHLATVFRQYRPSYPRKPNAH